jgi:hypothetical protein
MAEALALFSSIADVGTAAEAALKISKWMYRAAREIRGAGGDIEKFADKIDDFQLIIGAAHFTLDRHYASEECLSLTPLLQYMDKRQILEHLGATSHKILRHIKNLRPSIERLQSRLSLFSKVRWWAFKSEIEALGPEMECVKSSIHVLLTLVQMDMIALQQTTPGLQKEM